MPPDLYTELLGIPAGPRPPTHYELLGLPRFEQDKETIHKAVLRQTRKLKKWVLHPDPERADRIQEMLNEVHRAGVDLEDPKSKAVHDTRLALLLGVPIPETPRARPRRPVPPKETPAPTAPPSPAPPRKAPPGPVPSRPSTRIKLRPAEPRTPTCRSCGAQITSGEAQCPACGQDTGVARERQPSPPARPPSDRQRPPRVPRAPAKGPPALGATLAIGVVFVAAVALLTVVLCRRPPPPKLVKPPRRNAPDLVIDLGGPAMEFMRIGPDSSQMGDDGGRADERPAHDVAITKRFYLSRFEVTQEQWEAVMGYNPSKHGGGERPVEHVSWNDCQEFLRKLEEKHPGKRFRLPTEAEWEYACRAGSTTRFSFGDDAGTLGDYAWLSGNSGESTHAVGEKKANGWGLYDVHGNVWEWCQDWYAPYTAGAQSDPKGPATGTRKVLRGGAWSYEARGCRSAFRRSASPDERNEYFGFRVVHAPQESRAERPPAAPAARELPAAKKAWEAARAAADRGLLAQYARDEFSGVLATARRAKLWEARGEHKEAADLYRQAADALNAAVVAARAGANRALVQRIEAAIARGDKLEAEDILTRLAKLVPTHPRMATWSQRIAALPGPQRQLRLNLGAGVTMDLVLIRPGSFLMGDPSQSSERPVHKVTIARPFYLGKHEVTQQQWQAVMGGKPPGIPGSRNSPVVKVYWSACCTFLTRLNETVKGPTMRLPTEAEWEYACRAGSTTRYCFGDDAARLGRYAWFRDNAAAVPRPVGQKTPNAWGLYDMHGNAWEWCLDGYAPYSPRAQTDPRGRSASGQRVLRGGSWADGATMCRSASRRGADSYAADVTYGFRVLRPLRPETSP